MAWIRLDDHYDEHPKLAKVGPLGHAMFVAGLAYCNRNLTDGFVPWAKARNLLNWEFEAPDGTVFTVAVTSGTAGDDVTCKFVIGLLLAAGLWEEAEGGYMIHDYAEFQPTKAEVQADREQKRTAGQAGGKASAQARAKAAAQATAEALAQAESNDLLKQNPSKIQPQSQPQSQIRETSNKGVSGTYRAGRPSENGTPTPAEVVAYGSSLGMDESQCMRFFDRYDPVEWMNGTGQKITNWRGRMKAWAAEDRKNPPAAKPGSASYLDELEDAG